MILLLHLVHFLRVQSWQDTWLFFPANVVSEIFLESGGWGKHCDFPINLLNTAVNYEPEQTIYHPKGPNTTGKYFTFERYGLFQLIKKPSCLSLAFFLKSKFGIKKLYLIIMFTYLIYCYTQFLIKILVFFHLLQYFLPHYCLLSSWK